MRRRRSPAASGGSLSRGAARPRPRARQRARQRDADATSAAPALQRAAGPHGGRLEPLADGSAIVVALRGRPAASPPIRPAQAARCALALRGARAGPAHRAGDGRAARSAGSVPDGRARSTAPRGCSRARAAPRRAGRADRARRGERGAARRAVRGGRRRGRLRAAAASATLGRRARTLLGQAHARAWGATGSSATLDGALRRVRRRGAGRSAVLVTAPAGVGKSRLAAELLRAAPARAASRLAIWIGRGDSLSARARRSACSAQALRGALRHPRGRAARERRRTSSAARGRPSTCRARRSSSAWPSSSASSSARRSPTRTSARAARGAAGRAAHGRPDAPRVRGLPRRPSAPARPVLLVLEDLHWGDLATVQFVDAALRELGERPCMVLALARPRCTSCSPGCGPSAACRRSGSAGLRRARRASGWCARCSATASAPTRSSGWSQRADGNAFYLEELIRAAAEGKGDALPETVLAMVRGAARAARAARRGGCCARRACSARCSGRAGGGAAGRGDGGGGGRHLADAARRTGEVPGHRSASRFAEPLARSTRRASAGGCPGSPPSPAPSAATPPRRPRGSASSR